MSPRAWLFVAVLAAGCATPTATPEPPLKLPLVNADFEADMASNWNCPDGWGCVMHADPTSFRYYLDEKAPAAGKRSVCIEPLKREPWARAVQHSLDTRLRGKTLRFSALVKTEGTERGNEAEGGGVLIAAQNGNGRYVASKQTHVKSTSWQRVSAEIVIPQDTAVIEYGLSLAGPGKMCADDARIEVVP